jgi:hypothetical protein
MQFKGLIELAGKTATGIEVPALVLDALGGGRRPAVSATINGHMFRTSIGSVGGRSMLPVSADVRTQAGVSAGDYVRVTIAKDDAPRTVEVPSDLASELNRQPAVRQAFDKLSYSAQRRYVESVGSAKTDETRRRRVKKVIDELRTPR